MRLRPLALLLLLTGAASARLAAVDQTPLADRIPVVLIHGWNANESTWDEFVAAARQHPRLFARGKLYRFGYDWSLAVTTSAATLRGDLDALPELAGRPVALVGHSMGGLVARTFTELQLPGWDGYQRVGAVITLGTPHHGSPAANLGWLGGDSKYSLMAKLLPLGVYGILDRIPITAASRTEGGRDLGWDNYDGAMPADLWRGASRYLATLNQHLAIHPHRDELLLRYSFYAGYLTEVEPLSVLGLNKQVRAGDHYGAGASLLAHAYRNEQGQTVDRWAVNDGVVPLDSALFLDPGPVLARRADGRQVVDRARIDARLKRPGLVAAIAAGVDHSQLVRDPQVVGPLLDQLAALEFDALALAQPPGLAVYRPGDPAPRPLQIAGAPLASTAPDQLILAQPDALAVASPDSLRAVAAAPGQGWWLSPNGRLAISPDGALAGVLTPAYRRLTPAGQPVTAVLWSPRGERVAYTADGRLHLLEVTTLTAHAGTVDGAPAAGLRPVVWTPDGNWLLAADEAVQAAAFRPDGRIAALLVDPTRPAVAQVFGSDGASTRKWTVLPAEVAGPRLVVMAAGENTAATLAGDAATPVWSSRGDWLAWVQDAGATLGVRVGETIQTIPAPGRIVALTTAEDRLFVLLETAAGPAVAEQIVGTTALRPLAHGTGQPAGELLLSPTARYAAVPLRDGRCWVLATGGGWQATVPGQSPIWLRQPAARRWTDVIIGKL